ncbi:hypothetical protein [Streptacidiphilus sp. MAP5-3]|uniref:hypothetical protein n=1 Tax=unclassified Streptacidiphilus TaxID=2643834 RepID=UPI0035144DED
MRVRKLHTGSSGHGHVWSEPGQVLDIRPEDAAELVAIDPHEFEVLPDLPEALEDDGEDQGDDANEAATQPDAEPEQVTEPEATKTRGRRPRVTEA